MLWEIKYASHPVASMRFFKNKKCVPSDLVPCSVC